MWRFLKLLITLPVMLAIILFAVANRQSIRVSFDPFSTDPPRFFLDMPLFGLALAILALGVLIGGLAVWLSQGRHRKAERRLKREVTRLAGETAALRAVAPEAALATLPQRH
ncbi:MAG: LapA family protein [Hyphomicrobiales bacterium]|jgi:uncharacterized membrane protein YciS (DUF1049 family)|nr:LapA family protein [Hyphomicrobiales bacterium]